MTGECAARSKQCAVGSYWSWAVGTGLSTQLDILGRTVKRSIDVGIIYLASSIAFFAAFAFFPLLLAIVSLPPFSESPSYHGTCAIHSFGVSPLLRSTPYRGPAYGEDSDNPQRRPTHV